MSTIAPDSMEHDDQFQVVDTIALLQEEIARLESELRLRDELGDEDAAMASTAQSRKSEEISERRITELTAELNERERTIEVLWEQIGILEDAEAAGRAEWEQLHRWVDELEQRVESGGGQSDEAWAELESARRDSEALRDQVERERQTWSRQRRSMEEEIAGLRSRLEQVSRPGDPGEARSSLEQENRRLRQECHRLAAAEALAASAEDFRVQLAQAREELETARREAAQLRDQMESVKHEHQVELISARSQVLRERAVNPDGLTLNERMRALREHLSELHDQEEEERRQRRLSARIARLWSRTGPSA